MIPNILNTLLGIALVYCAILAPGPLHDTAWLLVAGGAGIPFTHASLSSVMQSVLDMTELERQQWRDKAMERVRVRYSWDAVTDSYETLLMKLAGRRMRSWVEVSLGRIRANYRAVCAVVGPSVEIMPVVKADAYRHGAVAIAHALENEGATWFAVSNVEEGVALRGEHGVATGTRSQA